jgi:hypothetical protein
VGRRFEKETDLMSEIHDPDASGKGEVSKPAGLFAVGSAKARGVLADAAKLLILRGFEVRTFVERGSLRWGIQASVRILSPIAKTKESHGVMVFDLDDLELDDAARIAGVMCRMLAELEPT